MINGNSVQRGHPPVVDLDAADAPPTVKALVELIRLIREAPRKVPLQQADLDNAIATVFCAVAEIDPSVQRWLLLRLADAVE